ncbi:hypothetical protein KEM60_03005 [Austwickia sp. TVS 96-490-7B]|uniref:Trm112 family protein n=1 Tax=Austwickia sp. TVS 96-490-7B TaxID=2830843 RepID=UPI001C55DB70|nr:hypothetical protein [Austwickia sp. TVS 96-490-7B]MBW3086776.1 hypothetical protein [Austwickia sp. TVS 96-490-7B]
MNEAIPGWVREILRCPVCRGELNDATGPSGAAVLECAGTCVVDGGRRTFVVEDGIPVLLADV